MSKLTLAILTLVMVSCGQSSPRSVSARYPIGEPVLSNNPKFLTKEITSCASSSFDHFRFDLSLFIDGNLETKNRDFNGLVDGLFVRDIHQQSVKKSTYGEKHMIIINSENGIQKNAFYQIPPVEGQDVTICPDQRKYGRTSIEGATLNVIHYIDKVYKKVKTLVPSLNLTPITLKMGSEYRFIELNSRADGIQQSAKYWVDNALYTPAEGSITFLPHDHNPHSLIAPGPSFWEIPMVAAHEYGHHIFHTLAPQTKTSTVLKGCFDQVNQLTSSQAVTATEALREAEKRDVEDAFNEGFADMIATYSLSKEEASLNQVRGLMINRDLNYNYMQFENYQMGHLLTFEEKKFNDNILGEFFSPRTEGTRRTYQDSHVIGSIFAHRADQFFNTFSLSKDQKLVILLEWAAEYGRTRSSMDHLRARSYFERMLQLLVRTTYKIQKKDITSDDCKNILAIYPLFAKTFQECANLE